VIAADAERLPNTTCVALPGASAETLVVALDLAGVAVSAGAACSSGKVGASHVLEAMGLEPALARAAIRVSLGWGSTERDVAAFADAWARVAARRRAVA
jgi:cysteine desulfurase